MANSQQIRLSTIQRNRLAKYTWLIPMAVPFRRRKWLALDIKYSNISITESKALAIMSKYSKVYVTNGSSIVSESKYDTYEIGKLNNFITTAGYATFYNHGVVGKIAARHKVYRCDY